MEFFNEIRFDYTYPRDAEIVSTLNSHWEKWKQRESRSFIWEDCKMKILLFSATILWILIKFRISVALGTQAVNVRRYREIDRVGI